MLQAGRGAGLIAEPLQPCVIEGPGERQDLERDLAAEGHLLGQVDDPHPASADLLHQPEVAEHGVGRAVRAEGERAVARRASAVQLAQEGQRRPDLAEAVSMLWMLGQHGLDLDRFAPPQPFGEVLDQFVQRFAGPAGGVCRELSGHARLLNRGPEGLHAVLPAPGNDAI
jgi:hypothetical protein